MDPQFLSVGYITRDFVEGREQAGGSAYYSATAALRLGFSPAILTSAAKDALQPGRFAGIQIANTDSKVTTTFTHYYEAFTGHRRHRCDVLADPVDSASLPEAWRKCPNVVICPNAQEVTPEALTWFESKRIALLPQGWFRKFHADGKVTWVKSKWDHLPRKVDLTVVSVDDISADVEAWKWIRKYSKVAVKTMGRRGHVVAWKGKEVHFDPPFVSKDVDPTGAGDVFSVAMLLLLSEGAEIPEAARFGSVAASFAVEARGIERIPNRKQVLERLSLQRVE